MNRTLDMQRWLNGHGAMLEEDGRFGPATRSAFIETFRNRSAPAATPAEVNLVADNNALDRRAMRAVAKVESGKAGGWDASGLLSCLYERHYMFRRVRVAFGLLSSATPGGYTVDQDSDGLNDSWEKLADAAGRWGMDTALECASFGRFQIMGAHWRALGYESARDFVWRLSRDENAHYVAFARFILANGLRGALNRVDGNPENCRAIAKGYNGAGYAKHRYHERIAAAWKADA